MPDVEEISGKIAGQEFSAKGLQLNTVLTLVTAIGVIGLGFGVWFLYILLEGHRADAKVMQTEFITAVKDQTVATKESAQAQREQNCLIAMPMDKRDPELCRRIAR